MKTHHHHRRRHSLPQLHRTLHRPSWDRAVRHEGSRGALNFLALGAAVVLGAALLLAGLYGVTRLFPDQAPHPRPPYAVPHWAEFPRQASPPMI